MTKSVKPPFFDRDDDQTMASDNNRPLNSKSKQMVYYVSGCCLKIKKKPFGLRKSQLKPRVLLELPLLVSDVRNLKEVDLSSPTGAKREPYKYAESFDKAAIQHNTILHCEETVADSKYSLFNRSRVSVISREWGYPEEALSLLLEIGL